jgi:hypothetical protein
LTVNTVKIGSVTSLTSKVVRFFNRNLQQHFLGRREGFVSLQQMLEDFRTEDFKISFKSMNRMGLKIWFIVSWYYQDEITGYFLREYLTNLLEHKQLLMQHGETEFLPYLINKRCATKAFEEEFADSHRQIFGLIKQGYYKDKEKTSFIFTFPNYFIKVKPIKKVSVQKYSGYCHGYKTGTPAKKDAGDSLRLSIEQTWQRKKQLYQYLFYLLPKIDEALFIMGFSDNEDLLVHLLEFKIKIQMELEQL